MDLKNKKVSNYYNKEGWEKGISSRLLDDEINRNHSLVSAEYFSKIEKKILNELNSLEISKLKLLDVGCGAIQIPERQEQSRNFKERHCVDFSKKALQIASKNLLNSGQLNNYFYNIEFLDNKFESNLFDATVCMHVLYHVDISLQEKFVRELIRVTKKNGYIFIAYSNPYGLINILRLPFRIFELIKVFIKSILTLITDFNDKNLYFRRKNIFWWRKFKDKCDIKISSLNTFNSKFLNFIIPNSNLGKKALNLLFKLENFKIWRFFSEYYIVILKVKDN